MTRRVEIFASRRDFTAQDAPTADAILAALQSAAVGQRGAWVGAVPLVGRDVSPGETLQEGHYVTVFSWLYEWPVEVSASEVAALQAAVARDLGSGWGRVMTNEALAQTNLGFFRARTGWGRNPNVFPLAQDDPMRGAYAVLSDPRVQGGLTLGGVGLGFYLLHRWLR